MAGDKALGPDGFTMAFFKACWEVVKDDIMSFMKNYVSKAEGRKALSKFFLSVHLRKNVVSFCHW